MPEFISIQELADELGIDRSTLRRYAKKQGFETIRIRTQKTRGQLTLAFTSQEAEAIKEKRQSQGFMPSGKRVVALNNSQGFFYIIQLIPEFDPNRIKLGFTNDVQARLGAHQTSAPTAILLKSWPSKRSWETAAIESITRSECKHIANEVYRCEDIENLLRRANEFFAIMPTSLI